MRVGEAISTRSQPQLPTGWNISQDVCSLQYRHSARQQVCLVKAIPMGAQLLISAVVSMFRVCDVLNIRAILGGHSNGQSFFSDVITAKVRQREFFI